MSSRTPPYTAYPITAGCLRASGVHSAPILAVADEMVTEEPWREFSTGFLSGYAFYGPEEEEIRLRGAGLTSLRVELIPKDMIFEEESGLAGRIRATWHRYLERLPEEARPAFIAALANRYTREIHLCDGRVHVPMVRLEIEAVKPSA